MGILKRKLKMAMVMLLGTSSKHTPTDRVLGVITAAILCTGWSDKVYDVFIAGSISTDCVKLLFLLYAHKFIVTSDLLELVYYFFSPNLKNSHN